MRKKTNLPEVKTWIAAAIKDEQRQSPDQLWKGGPTVDQMKKERLRRIRFLRKHSKSNAEALRLADRLQECCRKRLCLSGACLECSRLLQRSLGS